DPGLTPAQIAAATGISVRHLHRLFGDRGCTVAEWIWQQRLDRCRTDLYHSQASGRSITEIAFSWGFSDSAHFSRCFRKTFGLSPREFKSRASSMKFHALPTILPPRRLPRPN